MAHIYSFFYIFISQTIGESLEIRYSLQGYGIPVDLLPLTHTMTLKRQNHMQWISCRKYIESQEQRKTCSKQEHIDPRDLVDCPRSFDVIIGKAKYTNNPGNNFYKSLIEGAHEEHNSLSKREKVEMTWNIVRTIEKRGGRFLEMNKYPKSWVQIKDRTIARSKVAQSFKEYKRNTQSTRTKRVLSPRPTKKISSFHPITDINNDFNDLHNYTNTTVKRQKTIVSLSGGEERWLFGCTGGLACDEDESVDWESLFTSL